VKRDETVRLFRERLAAVMARSGLGQSAFARSVGLDRSTLSQLLAPDSNRLPRADGLLAIAETHRVSIDWLLGRTHDEGLVADIVDQAPLEFEPDARSPADERLARWHDEAAGYKIRYVPTSLPDLLKTERVIDYEYESSPAFRPGSRFAATQEKLTYLRRPETDMEVCASRQSVEAFARAEGQWTGLPVAARREQLARMIDLVEELYPSLRWFLYDARQHYSVPMNIFGPTRATLFVGRMYLVFNTLEHIRVFTGHFDRLIRAAVVEPTGVPDLLRRLHAEAATAR
jgi:transcriptional regulator with XRE-family HTH domain